jgi:hypothetical protein
VKPPPKAGDRRLDMIDVDELVAAIRNPKLHALEGIAASMLEFGYADTVVIDERTGRTISGHGRIEAVQQLRDKGEKPPEGVKVVKGKWLIPVNRGWASDSDAAAEAYLLAANRWNEVGGYDDEMRRAMIGDLAEYDEALLRAAGYDELAQHDILNASSYDGPRGQHPPEDFPEHGEKQADYQCPSCRHEWNGEPRP